MKPDRPEDLALPQSSMARLRLLVAFDALLAAGSVNGAADALGITAPAVSRILAQLRILFDDPLFERRGRRMMPTPLALRLKPRLARLAAEAAALLAQEEGAPEVVDADQDLPEAPRVQRVIRASSRPEPRLAHYTRQISGPQISGPSLTREQVRDAVEIILAGQASDLHVGAFLGSLHARPMLAVELAGVADALRSKIGVGGARVDLDWPAYLSPQTRTAPWFLLAAKLLAAQGRRILVHGWAGDGTPLGDLARALGVEVAGDLEAGERGLLQSRIAVLDLSHGRDHLQTLAAFHPSPARHGALWAGLQLLNPFDAERVVMALPKGARPELFTEAARLMANTRLMIVESGRDAAQATPHRMMRLHLQGSASELSVPVPAHMPRRPPPVPPSFRLSEYCAAVWTGQLRSVEADAIIIDSAALGIIALSPDAPDLPRAREAAREMWQLRDRQLPG